MPKRAPHPPSASSERHGSQRFEDIGIDWSQLLIDAVTKPGVISGAYTAFWRYSIGNQWLAMFECLARHIEPGPIHTFKGWLTFNRHVKKGEKGIMLCMPISWVEDRDPRESAEPGEDVTDAQSVVIRRRFIYRANWFVLSQTDGEDYVPLEIPQWNECLACHHLMIDREPFTKTDGNCQGYARKRRFAVSPIAYLPHRTAFHEIAHIVLGHTEELMGMSDGNELTPRDVREVEAEAVSLICCQSLGLPGEAFSRGYLQHWLGSQAIEDRSVHRIFKAADTILKAGRPKEPDPEESDPPTLAS